MCWLTTFCFVVRFSWLVSFVVCLDVCFTDYGLCYCMLWGYCCSFVLFAVWCFRLGLFDYYLVWRVCLFNSVGLFVFFCFVYIWLLLWCWFVCLFGSLLLGLFVFVIAGCLLIYYCCIGKCFVYCMFGFVVWILGVRWTLCLWWVLV